MTTHEIHNPMTGWGVSTGAGLGLTVGLLGWGAEGIGVGMLFGAGIGIVLGAVADAYRQRPRH